MTQLKALTYNIHKGLSLTNRRSVLKKIRTAIHEENPDVIFLQEVMGESTSPKHKDISHASQFEYIAHEFCDYFAYGQNVVNEKGRYGNAILSKYPILESTLKEMTVRKPEKRSMLHSRIQLPDMILHAFCIHLSLTEGLRKKQMKQLCDYINANIPSYEPIIVAGDFNDWQRHLSVGLEESCMLREAHVTLTGVHAKTFPNKSPLLTLDRIYFRGLKVLEAMTFKGLPWRKLSDHMPLVAVFEVGE